MTEVIDVVATDVPAAEPAQPQGVDPVMTHEQWLEHCIARAAELCKKYSDLAVQAQHECNAFRETLKNFRLTSANATSSPDGNRATSAQG